MSSTERQGKQPPSPVAKRKGHLGLWIRIGVAVAAFVWLGTHIDWRALSSTFSALRLGPALLALLVLWAGLGIAVLRWGRILRTLGSDLGLGETTRVFGSGLFLSLFLPTTIGGDVYRLARVSQRGFGPAKATISLLMERGVGLIALVLLVAPVVAIHQRTRDLTPVALLLGGGALGVVLVLALWGRAVSQFLATRMPALESALGKSTWDALMRQAVAVFGLSLIIHLTTVTTSYVFARALHVPITFWDALAVVPLVILAGQLPISPGGLGVREAGFVYFLGRLGIPKEQALAVGLCWLFSLYLTGAIGAILFLIDRRALPGPPKLVPAQAIPPLDEAKALGDNEGAAATESNVI